MLRAYGASDKGRVRPTNEDCFAVDEPLRLCVIADGMGGHNAGEVAARIAVDAVVDFVRAGQPAEWPFGVDPGLSPAGNLLRSAIYTANLQVLESAATVHAYAGMGTTIVASIVVDGRVVVAHVGDSRLYLMRNTELKQLTHDDSWMATMIASHPSVDPAALRDHPMRNVLTNVVGARTRTEVHVKEQPLAEGDRLLLTTDGVHGVLDETWLARILRKSAGPVEAAEQLISAALARGSRDNCTAIVADYGRSLG